MQESVTQIWKVIILNHHVHMRTYFFGIFHSICIIGKHFCTKSIIYQAHESVDLETKQESNTSFREMLLSDT